MKISCPACSAKYRISDERVRGKNRVFRIKCKKCSSEIRVRGIATEQDVGRATMPFNLELPDTAPATPQRVWFAGIGGKQVGPLTEQEVLDHISGGRLSADDLVWRKGFGAWTPVREVSPFQGKVNEAEAAVQTERTRSPRRSQTLELSAAMIELLVKLDAQQGSDGDGDGNSGDAGAVTPSAEPPSLPPLSVAGASSTAVSSTAVSSTATEPPSIEIQVKTSGGEAPPPVPDSGLPPAVPTEEQVASTRAMLSQASAAVVSTAVSATKTDEKPGSPGRTEKTQASASSAAEKSAARGRGKGKSRSRGDRPNRKSATKVALPGQTGGAAHGADASEAETKITSVPMSETAHAGGAKRMAATATTRTGMKTGAESTAAAKASTKADHKASGGTGAAAGKSGKAVKSGKKKGPVGKSSTASATANNKTSKPAAGAATRPKTKDDDSGGGWIIGLVLLLAIGGGGYWWWQSQQAGKISAAHTQPTKTTPVAVAPTVTPQPKAVEPAIIPEMDSGAQAAVESDVSGNGADTADMAGTVDAGTPSIDGGAASDDATTDAATAAAESDTAATAEANGPMAAAGNSNPGNNKNGGNKNADKKRRNTKRDDAKRDDAKRDRAQRRATERDERASARSAPPKSVAVVPKKQRDEIDILLEKSRQRERAAKATKQAAAKKAEAKSAAATKKAKNTAASRPIRRAAKADPIDEILRREAARKAAAADAKRAAATRPPKPPKAAGSGKRLTAKEVSRIAKSAKSKVMDCYMDHGDVDGGRVTFRVRIYVSASGSVQNAKVLGRIGAGALGSCIASKVKTLRFPQSPSTTKYTVRYTVGG